MNKSSIGSIDIQTLLHPRDSRRGSSKSQVLRNSSSKKNLSNSQSDIQARAYLSGYESESRLNPAELSDSSVPGNVVQRIQLQNEISAKDKLIAELEAKLEMCNQDEKELERNLFKKNSMRRQSLEKAMIALKDGVDDEDLGTEQLYSIIKYTDEMIMTLINENDQLNKLLSQKAELEAGIAARIEALEKRIAGRRESSSAQEEAETAAHKEFERKLNEAATENAALKSKKNDLTESNAKLQEQITSLVKMNKEKVAQEVSAKLKELNERAQKIEESNRVLAEELSLKDKQIEDLVSKIDQQGAQTNALPHKPKLLAQRSASAQRLNRDPPAGQKVQDQNSNISGNTRSRPPVVFHYPQVFEKESVDSKTSQIPLPFSPIKRMSQIAKETHEEISGSLYTSPAKYIDRGFNNTSPQLVLRGHETSVCETIPDEKENSPSKVAPKKVYVLAKKQSHPLKGQPQASKERLESLAEKPTSKEATQSRITDTFNLSSQEITRKTPLNDISHQLNFPQDISALEPTSKNFNELLRVCTQLLSENQRLKEVADQTRNITNRTNSSRHPFLNIRDISDKSMGIPQINQWILPSNETTPF